jgi:hypothetical protein
MLSNEMMLSAGGVAPVPPDFNIGHSVRFNGVDTAYMNRTPAVAGNRQKWTVSCWVKRSAIGTAQRIINGPSASNVTAITFSPLADDSIQAQIGDGTTVYYVRTSAMFRDPSVWYHIVFAVDTTLATSTDRLKLYVDGVQITAFSATVYPTLNFQGDLCSNAIHYIGRTQPGIQYLDAYLADVYLIDGQALTPTSFGKISPTNSNWVPALYTGTYGTTGFHLPFTSGGSAAALGTDTSGNSNTWTVNNISVAAGAGNDWLLDSPSNNYCTLNPVEPLSPTITNGALDSTNATSINGFGSFGVSTNKWYFECLVGGVNTYYPVIGFADPQLPSTRWAAIAANGQILVSGVWTAYGAAFSNGDIMMFAIDLDSGKWWGGKNGTWYASGDPASGTNPATTLSTPVPAMRPWISHSSNSTGSLNFGQRAFSYTPPTGFLSLNQTNLPTPITTQPYLYNNTALYAGTGAPQSIINLHLQPDLVWLKSRSNAADHSLYDSIRGAQAHLSSNLTDAEATADAGLLSFLADGFSLGTLAQTNTSAQTYAAWTWKESVTAGFDIVSYTGAGVTRTVAHSLGVIPELMIVKIRGIAGNWLTYHKDMNATPQNGYLLLNQTGGYTVDNTAWNNTAPTSSVFTVHANTSLAGGNYIAYLFASKEGYSKFGKFTGNGSVDGPFVYCGFKPKFVIFKDATVPGANWNITDGSRNTYNPVSAVLSSNTANAESSANAVHDFTANGFKLRIATANGSNYIFMAFAESPFKYPRTQFSSSQTGLNLKGLRFNSADTSYLNRTPAVAGNRKTWTFSAWVKRGALGIGNIFHTTNGGSPYNGFHFDANDNLNLWGWTSSYDYQLTTSAVFRDPSQWYHFVIVFDSTQATAANRVKLYVNGVQITAFSTATYPALNYDSSICNTVEHRLGRDSSGTNYFNGYISDVYLIDGQTKLSTDFAMTNATTGQWVPQIYTGTYGTNGCHLTFSDSSSVAALGTDTSGNGNTWTVNSMSVTNDKTQDCLSDSPTENYCTLSPLETVGSTLANGALDFSVSVATSGPIGSTFSVSSGKWYWEVLASTTGSAYGIVGVWSDTSNLWATNAYPGSALDTVGYIGVTGNKVNGGVGTAYGNSWTAADIIGVALDMDNGKIWFSKNGTWQASGDPVAGTNAALTGLTGAKRPGLSDADAAAGWTGTANFGQRPFAFNPPTGFKALNSTNLPGPTILLPNAYMNTKLYTGTGASLALTGVGHQPDLVWIKGRSGATDHTLYDSTRGVQAHLSSNDANAETTTDAGLTAFGSDGFTVNTLAQVNTNAATYAAWCFKKSATPGFDIVTGTSGASPISHSLGVKPSMIIAKATSVGGYNWVVTHKDLGTNMQDYYLHLNLTWSSTNTAGIWGGEPTSSAFYASTSIIGTSANFVAYLFVGVDGYSKFGKYTGNGSADGPFVWCGFRPKFVLFKNASAAVTNWQIFDSSRSPYNQITNMALFPDLSFAEGGTNALDILSNGFKIRQSDPWINGSGNTIIFAAFSDSPFKYSRGR